MVALIDEITSLRRDAYVYDTLTQMLARARRRKSLSERARRKFHANFAEDSARIPILKYSSRKVWGTGVFGATAKTETESILLNNDFVETILDEMKSLEYAPAYNFDDLVDPVIFKEWVAVYSKLKMKYVDWLATHRTRIHTFRSVQYNWDLWVFHIDRIFQRLSENLHAIERADDSLTSFIEREFDQAAKDVRQALDKILNKDVARYQVIKWMEELAGIYPLAAIIKQSIEPPFKVNKRIVLMARIRRCYTTLLRLHLTGLGLASKHRVGTRKMPDKYLRRLERYSAQLGKEWEQWSEQVEDALVEKPRTSLREFHKLFNAISTIESFNLWFDDKQLILDQWVIRESRPKEGGS